MGYKWNRIVTKQIRLKKIQDMSFKSFLIYQAS